MFISPAYAQAAAGGSGEALMQFLPLILIFVVFYFLLIRPQQKRQKEHKAVLEGLRRGDRVVTGGGIIGTVAKVLPEKDEIDVDIAEGVRVKVMRSSISTVVARTEPAKPAAVAAGDADGKEKRKAAGGQ
jgi:preprotein translocase subunit YajC